MIIHNTFKVSGELRLVLLNEDRSIAEERTHKNLVVAAGKRLIASRLFLNTRGSKTLTGISGNGSVAVATFATELNQSIFEGDSFTIVDSELAAFNGTYTALAATTSSVTFDNDFSGTTASAHGSIASLNNLRISQIRVGASLTSPNLNDSALWQQLGTSGSLSQTLDDTSVVYIGAFLAGVATGNIAEAGLFNADGVMACRTTFPPIVKGSGQTLQIFWRLTIA